MARSPPALALGPAWLNTPCCAPPAGPHQALPAPSHPRSGPVGNDQSCRTQRPSPGPSLTSAAHDMLIPSLLPQALTLPPPLWGPSLLPPAPPSPSSWGHLASHLLHCSARHMGPTQPVPPISQAPSLPLRPYLTTHRSGQSTGSASSYYSACHCCHHPPLRCVTSSDPSPSLPPQELLSPGSQCSVQASSQVPACSDPTPSRTPASRPHLLPLPTGCPYFLPKSASQMGCDKHSRLPPSFLVIETPICTGAYDRPQNTGAQLNLNFG